MHDRSAKTTLAELNVHDTEERVTYKS